MISFTLQEIVNLYIALGMVNKVPVQTAFKLMRLKEELQTYVTLFEKQRTEILEEAGAVVNGDRWDIPQEFQIDVAKKVSELFQTKCDINFTPIEIELLADSLAIEPEVLLAMSKILCE